MPFSGLAANVMEVRGKVEQAVARGGRGQAVSIVAVTKTHGPDAAHAAWETGIRAVGENKVQEALSKMDLVSVPVEWHLIGHLQRNKVKHLDRFALFHALDSARLADAIHSHYAGTGRRCPVLVQVNASGEESKGGFSVAELGSEAPRLRALDGLEVRGVMTMAPLDANEGELRSTFGACRDAVEILKDVGHPATELSMGMSNDYEIAVEEGATMIRLGTILFGARQP
jgi:PLP dependent protein